MSWSTNARRSAGVSVSSTTSRARPDRVGEQRLVLGVVRRRGGDDRIGHAHIERLLAPGVARAQHVEADAGDDGRQPAAKVVDLACVGAARAAARLLDGVVGLAVRAEHAIGDRPKVGPVLLKLPSEPFLLIHVTFLFRRVSWKIETREIRGM